eukprot:403355876
MMFLVPLGYFYGREHILNFQNNIYYKLFGIKEQHLQQYKQKLLDLEKQDQEKLMQIEKELKQLQSAEDSKSKDESDPMTQKPNIV